MISCHHHVESGRPQHTTTTVDHWTTVRLRRVVYIPPSDVFPPEGRWAAMTYEVQELLGVMGVGSETYKRLKEDKDGQGRKCIHLNAES